MPIFEYKCESCEDAFELIVNPSTRPACPKCGGEKLSKQLSVFSASASPGSAHVHSGSCGCGKPQGGCGLN